MTTVPAEAPPTGPDEGAPVPARASWTQRVPWFVAVPVAVVAGAALDAAFPSVGAWGLAFPAVAAGLLLARGRGLAGSAGLGLLFGLAFMVPQLSWSGIYVGPVPWLALSVLEAALLALAFPGWTLAWRVADRWAPWSLPLTAGAVWVAAEAARSRWPFDGFGWGRLGFSQADSPLLGLAALGGAPLVGFGVAALSAALLLVVLSFGPGAGPGRARRDLLAPAVTVVVTVVVVALAALGGSVAATGTAAPTDEQVRVAAVQGDVPQAGLDFNAQRRAVLDNHVRGTLELAERIGTGEEQPVDLVLWPENASDIDPLLNEDADELISGATDAVDAPVLLGAVLQGPGENITNAVLLWDPTTGFRGRSDEQSENGWYAKQAVVPFAEYVPYRAFFRNFSPFVDQVTDFAPGDGPAVLEAGGALVGAAICFEVVEDDVVRDQVLAGADLLVVPTNNATFGLTDENVQQLAMSRLRAVEHGRSLVHISNVGTSAVIAADGSTGRRTGMFSPDVLVADVQLRSGRTPATVLGPAPELALVAVALLLVVGHGVSSLRREGLRAPGRAAAADGVDVREDLGR